MLSSFVTAFHALLYVYSKTQLTRSWHLSALIFVLLLKASIFHLVYCGLPGVPFLFCHLRVLACSDLLSWLPPTQILVLRMLRSFCLYQMKIKTLLTQVFTQTLNYCMPTSTKYSSMLITPEVTARLGAWSLWICMHCIILWEEWPLATSSFRAWFCKCKLYCRPRFWRSRYVKLQNISSASRNWKKGG